MIQTRFFKKTMSLLLSFIMLYNGMFSELLNTVSVVNAETIEEIVDTAPVSDEDIVTVSDRVESLSYVSEDEEQQDELYRYSIKINERVGIEEVLLESGFCSEEDVNEYLFTLNTKEAQLYLVSQFIDFYGGKMSQL